MTGTRMEVLVSLLFTLVLIVLICYWIMSKRFAYWKERGVPHDPPTFPHGNSKELRKTENIVDLTEKYYRRFKDLSPFFGVYLFVSPVAVITDLELVKTILIKEFQSFTNRGLFYNEKDDPLSAHLFNIDNPEWRFLRNKLSPTFTSGKMKFMFPTIVAVGEELRDTVTKMVKVEPTVEIKEILSRFTTDVIGSCAFGIECNSLKNPNAEFRIQGRSIFEIRRHKPFTRAFLQAFPKFSKKIGMKIWRDEVSNFFINAVANTVKFRQNNNISRNDFMDILLKLKNDGKEQFTLEQVAAQAFVFFIAGFETSSLTMGFALYELALNQNIQDKLRQEISDVLQKNKGQISYEVTNEMPYLEKVIYETLRKYPPIPILIRKAIDDFRVPGTKYIIEKDTKVHIPTYSIHHDSNYYPDPELFDPERFSPENIRNRHSCAFLGFGDGPRNCIGLRFGKMQAFVGLIMMIGNFKFTVSQKTQIPLKFNKKGFTLSSEAGIDLNIEKL